MVLPLVVVMAVALHGAALHAEENLSILPGAASIGGAQGTMWRSDLQVLNPGGAELEIRIRFVPFDAGPGAETTFPAAAGEVLIISDIVSRLGTAGAGTLEITAPGPFLTGMRTYNQSDGETFGQFIPPAPALIQGQAQPFGGSFLPGVIENDSYRTNLGVFNPGDGQVSWTLNGDDGTIDPHSGWQRRVTGCVTVDGDGDTVRLGGDPVISYLSVIDNATGDPTFVPAQSQEVSGVLVGVAHLAGAGGSHWRSDLFLHAEDETTVLLELRPWGRSSGPGTTVFLQAGETLVMRDVVSSLTDDEAGGMLTYSATHPLSVVARTYNQATEGTFGQGILPATTMEEGYFLFVREDEDFRSNLALVNPTDTQVAYTLELFSAQGSSLGRVEESVPGGTALQLNTVIRRFGLQTLSSGYIKVSGGLFGGYVSCVDNASGDAATVLPLGLGPVARVTGASVFGDVRALDGRGAEARISILDTGQWSLVSQPVPNRQGRFFADLPGPGEYWIIAATQGGLSGARWLEVSGSPVEARILLRPDAGGDKSLAADSPVGGREQAKDQIGTGTISVVVLDACDDSGIAHADVRLVNVATGLIPVADETGADGRVTFNDVPVYDSDTAGGLLSRYMVIAGGWALNRYEACHYATVLLGVGDISEVEIKMMPKESEDTCFGMIQGRVLDECAGEPLAGAEVKVVNGLSSNGCDETMEELEATFTDGDGSFALEKVVPGSVQLLVGAPTVEESIGDCLACYWIQYRDLEVERGQTSNVSFSLDRKGIVFLGQVRDREHGDPVVNARADFVNENPRASQHGPLYTNEDGIFIFSIPTGPAFAGVTSGTLEVHLTDWEDSTCTTDDSFEICEWEYDEQLVLSCSEDWSGSYTTTITYSEVIGGATMTRDGEAHGEISFAVDAQGRISGTAHDDQLITVGTPGCTTTLDGAGRFAITGERVGDRYRLFFDDEESFVYEVTTRCEGAPTFTETQTGAAELQYAPMIEVGPADHGRSLHLEDTHSVEHVGTYTIVLDATRD